MENDYSSYNLTNYSSSQSKTTVSGSAEKLEGMDTIWKYDVEELTEVNISYSLTVTSGKAKFVYVDPDGTVSTFLESSAGEDVGRSEYETLKIKEGENRIHLVGAEGTGLEYKFTDQVKKLRVGKKRLLTWLMEQRYYTQIYRPFSKEKRCLTVICIRHSRSIAIKLMDKFLCAGFR